MQKGQQFIHGPPHNLRQEENMAQGRHQLGDSEQVNARLSMFNILPDEDAPSLTGDGEERTAEDTSKKATESDEREDADASEGEEEETEDTAEAEDSEDGEGDDSEDKGGDDSKIAERITALEASLAKAEERERSWQSRYDRSQAALERALSGATQTQQTDGGDDLADIPDDDVLTGKQLKDIMSRQAQRANAERQKSQTQQQRTQWVATRPDIQDVARYVNEHTSELEDIPTDEVGLYHAAKAQLLERQVQEAEQRLKAEVEKARADERKKLTGKKKPAIPPTGGNGAPRASRTVGESLEPISKNEERTLNFFRQFDEKARIVSSRR